MSIEEQSPQGAADTALLHAARTVFSDKSLARIGVAVSGGGDSMALLHLYARLARAEGFQVEAVTVNHGLRPAAADEAAVVAAFCAANDIPHVTLAWDNWDQSGNLMAAARAARYRLIAEWALTRGLDGVVLGHTRDDLAENFLIRLARKAGTDGLAKMDTRFVRHGVQWARPLSGQTRADLRSYLERQDVAWVEDPTNEDEAFDRTRARQALKELAPLGIDADVLASVSGSMRRASDALRQYTRIESRRYIVQDQSDLVLRLGLTGPLPSEIKRRLWAAAIQWVNGADYPPRQAAFLDVIRGLTSDGTVTVAGCLITRKGDDWRVTRELQAVQDTVSRTDDLWDGRWRFDGPHAPDLQLRPLAEGIKDCPEWRETGIPRTTLIATPAVWQNETLVAAPMAGLANNWSAQIVADFHSSAFAH